MTFDYGFSLKIFNNMKVKLFFTVKLISAFLLLFTENTMAQNDAPTHVLYPKSAKALQGKLLFLNEKTILFADNAGEIRSYEREAIDSLVFIKNMVSSNANIGLIDSLKTKYPNLQIPDNLKILDKSQLHIVMTSWGQRFRGLIISLTLDGIILTTQNGSDLPFEFVNIKEIKVKELEKEEQIIYRNLPPIKSPLVPRKFKPREKITSYKPKQLLSVPTRIGIVPTALNPPAGQVLFRGSAIYINEFLVAGKFFNASFGTRFFSPFIKGQVNFPVKKYIYLGILAEVNATDFFNTGSTRIGKFAFSPIVTIGNPSYFLNFSYKSKAPIFLPINDSSDDRLMRESSYWSFGGGVLFSKRWQFLTESMLIKDVNNQRHYRIFWGMNFQVYNHTFGFGFTKYDTDDRDDGSFEFGNSDGFLPSFQYIVRF